jgi:hypothetical protein
MLTSDDDAESLGLVVGDFKRQLGAKGILTGVSGGAQSGFQVMHSLRQYIHIYTFGERVGELTVSGLAFMRDCTTDAGGGMARLYDWYELNRISHTGSPVTITLTRGVALKAFLVGFRYQMEDPGISLMQFSMQFIHPPRIKPAGSTYSFIPASLTGTMNITT